MTAAAVSRNPEPYEVPEGGLASFLTATVGDWSDEALNADNYYDIVKPTADQLAEFGREEDDRIAHVATGETIIPMAVFEEDPALKEALFARMRDMGIDPERYIVGSDLNSINPVTGQPEFFLKKIFKGVKKAVKGVVKVFKKLAPVILSVGLNYMFPGLGTIAAGALGSGIGTLVQGGSLKDAFKAAALGGAVGGLASGVGSVMQGGEFLAGVKSGLPTGFGGGINPTLPGPDISKISEATPDFIASEVADPTALTAAEAVQQGGFFSPEGGAGALSQSSNRAADLARASLLEKGPTAAQLAQMQAPTLSSPPAGGFFSPEGGAGALSQSANTAADLAAQEAAKLKAQGLATGTANTNITAGLTPPGAPSYDTPGASAKTIAERSLQKASTQLDPFVPAGRDAATTAVDAAGTTSADTSNLFSPSTEMLTKEGIAQLSKDAGLNKLSFLDSIKKFFTTGKPEFLKQAFIPDSITAGELKQFFTEQGIAGYTPEVGANILDSLAQQGINPGLLRKYLPGAIAGTGIASAAGFFDQPEMEPLPDAFGGMTGQKLIDMYPSQYTLSAPGAYIAPSMAAADGGGIDTSKFPRRNGKISGPGTETSDDIPAMLSDGEFVMTARAVRGAGNGSREAGMRNMYNMMSRFEGNA